jgi:predicted lipid-binding transport protein (Tim44 family)
VFGLVVGLVVWVWAGLGSGVATGLSTGLVTGLPIGLVTGLVTGLTFGLLVGLVYPQSWSSFLAFAQLAASDRTPVRLMRFLEDARSRGVLRTVGPVYQFRHARLQDRLAAREPETGEGPGEPPLTAGDAAVPTAEAPPASPI